MLRRSSYEILCYFLEVVTLKFFPGFFFSTGIRQRIPQYFKRLKKQENSLLPQIIDVGKVLVWVSFWFGLFGLLCSFDVFSVFDFS